MGGVGLVQKEAGDVNDYESKEITAEAAAGFMEAAFELAREALAAGEVPVGAVIVAGGQVGAAEKYFQNGLLKALRKSVSRD